MLPPDARTRQLAAEEARHRDQRSRRQDVTDGVDRRDDVHQSVERQERQRGDQHRKRDGDVSVIEKI